MEGDLPGDVRSRPGRLPPGTVICG